MLVRFGEMAPAKAHAILARLVELYLLGQTLPLCFFPGSSFAYAKAKHAGKDDAAAESAARTQLLGAGYSKGARPESEDPYVEKVLAGSDPVEPGFRVINASSRARRWVTSRETASKRLESPLVSWIWLGTLIIVLGAGLTLVSPRQAARRTVPSELQAAD